uniref:Putative chaperone protein DNAj n=1 Tax=Trypanosoma congolense (strain IL3000) TaxID=1068625 RepID=G0UR43_TRYCI|nr:putative chaperone protein DNAj [Trypanosoma congolense IL3000]
MTLSARFYCRVTARAGVMPARHCTLQRRLVASHTSSSSSRAALAEELRCALRLLSLSDEATDVEVRERYQSIVKTSHPDVQQGGSPQAVAGGDKLHRCVDAYRLLRRHSEEERKSLLSSGKKHSERGQHIYEGIAGRYGSGDTATARFNRFQQRQQEMRDAAPPWRVNNGPSRRKARGPWCYLFGATQRCARDAADELLREYRRTGHLLRSSPIREERPPPPNFFSGDSEKWLKARERARRANLVTVAYGRHIIGAVFIVTIAAVTCLLWVVVKKCGIAQRLYVLKQPQLTADGSERS